MTSRRAPNGSRSHPARAAGRDASRILRRLVVAATAATFVLVALGGLVRATGSGLGCVGWPKCTADGWLPPLEYHALIEYAHRFVAFVDVVLIASVALVATRRRAGGRLVAASWAAVGLVLFQAALGGIVVRAHLEAILVSAHLGTAMLLAGTLVYLTAAAYVTAGRQAGHGPGPGASGAAGRFARSAWLTAGAALALILVGATVRAEGAGLAFPDWPLMNGVLVPDLGALGPALHFAHRALALVVGILVAGLAVRGWRRRDRDPVPARLAVLAAGLFVAQVLVGAAAVWSRLEAPTVVAHVALSSLIWGALVGAASVASLASAPAVERRAAVRVGSLAPEASAS